MEQFIVAEITQNWEENVVPAKGRLISKQFEKVINQNLERGYILKDWKLNQVVSEQNKKIVLTETIIAVFEKMP